LLLCFPLPLLLLLLLLHWLQLLLCAPDVLDQLQLAFNKCSADAAVALTAQLLSLREQPAQLQACLAQLDEQAAQQLLSTALLQHHFDAAASFEGLLRTCKPDWSFIATVAAALTLAVEQQDGAAVACLCKLRSTQQLQPTVVAGLLLQAMQQEDNVAVVPLSELAAAAQLPASSAVQLLQAALQKGFTDVATVVCEQQAAQEVDAAAMIELLLTAVQQQQLAGLEELSQLQPAQMLHVPAAQQLLQAAMATAAASEDGDLAALDMLLDELPAAEELGEADMVILLQSAISQSQELAPRLVRRLWQLPASQSLSAGCISQLLIKALEQQQLTVVTMLCMFDGAASISKQGFERIVLLADKQAVLHKVAPKLFALRDVVDFRQYFKAASAAVAARDVEAIRVLARVKGLPRECSAQLVPHVHRWLADAALQHQRELASALCKVHVRQTHSFSGNGGIAALLHCVADGNAEESLSIILQEVLDSRGICTAEQAAQAVLQEMQAAVKEPDVQLLRCLAGCKSAEGLDACSMTGLLWWTLQHKQHEAAAVLLELQCAQQCVSSCKALQRAVHSIPCSARRRSTVSNSQLAARLRAAPVSKSLGSSATLRSASGVAAADDGDDGGAS
jgi:hypothetical protein